MAFNRPSLPAIIKRVRKDIKVETGIVTILRRSFVNAITKAISGVAHLLHGHLDFLSLQILPTSATGEFLRRHFDFWGFAETAATLEVDPQTGDVILAIHTLGTQGADIASIQQAILEGQDPTELLEETAAGNADRQHIGRTIM